MWTFTTFFLFIVCFLLGMLARNWWVSYQQKNKTDWKSKYQEIEKEYKDFSKKLRKEEKGLVQARRDRDEWKEKFENLDKKFKETKESNQENVAALDAEIKAAQKEARDINILKSHSDKDAAKWKKEFEKLKAKYATDAGDVKAFRNDREKLEKDIVKYKTLAGKCQKEIAELKAEIEKNAEQMSSLRALKRDFRKAKSLNSKYQKDLEYWEKKHYDTHHELAALKEAHEILTVQKNELNDFRNGDQIVISNMKKQIELFKSKFLEVDRKYKKLITT